ncbi:hypothetical protein SLE2022_293680 [Rubroshorea leprosula]
MKERTTLEEREREVTLRMGEKTPFIMLKWLILLRGKPTRSKVLYGNTYEVSLVLIVMTNKVASRENKTIKVKLMTFIVTKDRHKGALNICTS